MRITHEADYAIRIVSVLAKNGDLTSAKSISDDSGVPLRFALKILGKLCKEGIVDSKKGSFGGYFLTKALEELSVGEIVECIDGPFELNHCLSDDYTCSKMQDKSFCPIHHFFDELSSELKEKLYSVKLSQLI